MTNKHIGVIGGGPAGMMAALYALRAGARVKLLEQNNKLGKKLYITGKGRCNVSNAAEGEDFLRNIPRNPRFLYASLDFLSPAGLRDLMDELGCPTVIERGQRVFPAAQKASEVTKTLTSAIAQADVRLNAKVEGVSQDNAGKWNVSISDGDVCQFDALIIATGGISYPVTGSTGDGHRFAEQLGHTVTPLHASLVPVETDDAWVPLLQGLSLKNVRLRARRNGKTIFDEQGEMLFAHFGITGPLVLTLSAHLAGQPLSNIRCDIDMKPALSQEQLEDRLQRDMAASGKKQLRSILPGLLPQKMAEVFTTLCKLDWYKQCSQVTAQERKLLAQTLKAIPLTLSRLRPVEEAVVTRGGISVKDIDPGTMASKRHEGLYFAGEVMDVDGFTGGFNLQIAFSTAALAGHSAAHYEPKEK